MRATTKTGFACFSLFLLAVPPALWGQAKTGGTATKTTPAKKPAAAPKPKPSLLTPASLSARAPEVYKAKFTTAKGDFFVVEVTRAWAPIGADRFYNLVRDGFFNDAHFFRVISGFIVQFGLPASPQIAAVWQNANLKDDPVKESNRRGTLTFATAGPNTRTTQMFINLGDNGAALDRQGFAPLGKVIEGMDVVDKLYNGYGEKPDQGRITAQGKAYLVKQFPNLDSIKTAVILPQTPPPPPPAKK